MKIGLIQKTPAGRIVTDGSAPAFRRMIYKTFSAGQTKKMAGLFGEERRKKFRRLNKKRLGFGFGRRLGAGKTALPKGF